MKWIDLVPDKVCKTDIDIVITEEGLDEDGAPIETAKMSLRCNFQDGAKQVLASQKKTVRISGKAFFNGDICPSLPVISGGYAEIFGVRRDILEGYKWRNPDGTVNYTEILFV